ncbi:hypothetical protein C9374_005320 [Naegleria lovaniensis]|uniref:IBB domain-containing protein n=1 Tax=Naegleria lovaniensis TaxID=51637 RepID=A0AA88GRG0_NAELO|nr:uncharacterized protein C9374_005320 [Naegleria lovaniensis]KAG2382740.1 hypothetical protein C9374_005320 [Naegleria lovaniensis]
MHPQDQQQRMASHDHDRHSATEEQDELNLLSDWIQPNRLEQEHQSVVEEDEFSADRILQDILEEQDQPIPSIHSFMQQQEQTPDMSQILSSRNILEDSVGMIEEPRRVCGESDKSMQQCQMSSERVNLDSKMSHEEEQADEISSSTCSTIVVSAVGSEYCVTQQLPSFGIPDTCQPLHERPFYFLPPFPSFPCASLKKVPSNRSSISKEGKSKKIPQAWKQALENQKVKKQIQKQRKMLQRDKMLQRRRELTGRVEAIGLNNSSQPKRETSKHVNSRIEIPLSEFKKQKIDKRKSLMRELSLEWIICEEVLLRFLNLSTSNEKRFEEMSDDILIEQIEQQLPEDEEQRGRELSQIVEGVYQKSVKSLQRVYDLLNIDSMDIEDVIDSILDSDTLSHVKSYYLDRNALGKYLNVLNHPKDNITMDNETSPNMEMTTTKTLTTERMIQQVQQVAVLIVKKLSGNGRIDQLQTLSNQLDISLIVQLIQSRHLPIVNDALFILANIAKISSSQRDQVLQSQIVKELTSLLSTQVLCEENEQHVSLLRMASWCFSKLCVGTPSPSKDHMKQLLTLTPYFLHRKDIETLTHTCRAIGRLMYPKEMISPFLQSGQSSRIIDLIQNRNESEYSLLAQALVAAVNISAGTDEETQHLVTLDILEIALKILRLPLVPKSVRIDAMILVSNVCACTEVQVQRAIDCGVLEEIAKLFNKKDTLLDLKKEAVWIFRNAINSGEDEHVELFTERYQIVPPICEMITNGQSEQQIKNMCLQTLVKILEYYESETGTDEMAQNSSSSSLDSQHLNHFNEIIFQIKKSGAAKEILQMDVHASEYVEALCKYLR